MTVSFYSLSCLSQINLLMTFHIPCSELAYLTIMISKPQPKMYKL